MELNGRPIGEYEDYRVFLNAVFEMKKKTNHRFSFRRFAELAGLKSPNYLQLIIEGRRNLTLSTARQIAGRLKFASGEKEYFLSLVKFDGARDTAEKNEAIRARLTALKKIVARDIPLVQKEIFGRWFYLLVRELFFLPTASADPAWICDKLGGLISLGEAGRAVQLLTRLGLLKEKGGQLVPEDPVLDTNDQNMQASLLRDLHADTLKAWAAHLHKLSPADQELGVLNIPIRSENIPELRRRIRQFQDEIIGWVQEEKQADRVVQLGTYLIPFP